MDVLVLGGTRFIGLRLVQLLHGQGHRITVLNRGTRKTALPDGVASISADREVPSQVAAALRGRSFDAAFDISAYTPATLRPAVEALDGNVGSYVFCSTTGVYARSDVYPIRDDFPLDRAPGASDYTRGKVACEDLLRDAHARTGFPATMLRPPVVYGPHNALPERDSSFFARVLQGRTVIIPGDGSNLLQPVHVDDLAAAFVAASGSRKELGQAYTISGESATTVDYWVRTIGRVVGKPVDVVNVEGTRFDRLNEELGLSGTDIYPFGWGRNFCFSVDRAKGDLGWSPQYDIRDGLAMTYRWWLDQGLDKGEWDFSADDRMLARLSP